MSIKINNIKSRNIIPSPSSNQILFSRKTIVSIDGVDMFSTSNVSHDGVERNTIIHYVRDKVGQYIIRNIIKLDDDLPHQYFGNDMVLSTDKSTLLISDPSMSHLSGNTSLPDRIFIFKRTNTGDYILIGSISSSVRDKDNVSCFGHKLCINYDGSIIATKNLIKVTTEDLGEHYRPIVSLYTLKNDIYINTHTLEPDSYNDISAYCFGDDIAMSAFGIKILVSGSLNSSYGEVYVYSSDGEKYKLSAKLSELHRVEPYREPSIAINRLGTMIFASTYVKGVSIYTLQDKKWELSSTLREESFINTTDFSQSEDYHITLSPNETTILLSKREVHCIDSEEVLVQPFFRSDKSSTVWNTRKAIRCVSDSSYYVTKPHFIDNTDQVVLGLSNYTFDDDLDYGETGHVEVITLK